VISKIKRQRGQVGRKGDRRKGKGMGKGEIKWKGRGRKGKRCDFILSPRSTNPG